MRQCANGLLAWFCHNRKHANVLEKIIFSGLPKVVLAKIIRDSAIPKTELFVVYHEATQLISKFDLLKLVAEIYGKKIKLIPVNQPVCDQSFKQARYNVATGCVAPEWPELIRIMYNYKLVNG